MGKAELKIEVDEALLAQLRSAGVDVESLTQQALEAAARRLMDGQRAQADADAWAAENAQALRAYEERIAKYGVFGEDFRTW